MPVPTLITDLSTTANSNSPGGGENVFPDNDNFLRALSAFVASIRDNSGNGWVSPYLPLSGGTVTGNLTVNGNTALGDAVTDTLSIGGSLVKNATGNYTLPAPSSGGHEINGLAAAGMTIDFVNGSTVRLWQGTNAGATGWGTRGAHDFSIATNGLNRTTWSSGGNVTTNAPSSGVTETVNAVASGVPVSWTDGTKTANLSFGTNVTFGPTSNHQLDFRANNTTWLSLTTDGRLYGTALHNNAGSVSGTENQYIARSGDGSLAATAGANCSSVGSVVAHWVRNGNNVSGSMNVANVDPTAASAETVFTVALPVTNTAGGTTSVSGTAVRAASNLNRIAGSVTGGAANTLVVGFFNDTDTAARDWVINFSYTITS